MCQLRVVRIGGMSEARKGKVKLILKSVVTDI